MSRYEIVLTVYEMGSVSKAAAKLNYSQPAVSQAIQSFEKELGVPLFKRSKAGVQLLSGAEDVMKQIELIVEVERRIGAITDAMKNLDQGLVRIGSVSSIASWWLPKLLSAFAQSYPNIRFELCVSSYHDLQTMLDNESIDVAFTSRMAANGFEFVSMAKDDLMVVMPPEHSLAENIAIPVSWLNEQTLIIPAEGVKNEIEELLRSNDISTEEGQYIVREDYETTLRLVEYGFGVSILPRLFLDGQTSSVYTRPLAERYFRELGIAYLDRPTLSFAAKKFIHFTEEWIREYQSEKK